MKNNSKELKSLLNALQENEVITKKYVLILTDDGDPEVDEINIGLVSSVNKENLKNILIESLEMIRRSEDE